GQIISTGLVLISKEPMVTMEMTVPVEIKDGQVCGKVQKSQITAAKFATRGQALSTLQTELLRQQFAIGFERLFGHELCTGYVNRGGKLFAEAFVDGTKVEAKGVMWVAKDEGYTVSP